MDNVEHIFFDLDHTLWDFDANSSAALQELFVEFSDELSAVSFDVFLPYYKGVNEAYWARYRLNQVSKEELRVGRFLDAFNFFNLNLDFNFADAFARRYLEISPYKTQLFKGAIKVLKSLNANYKLHIITNGFKEVQYIKLENSRLKHFFDTIVCSEETGVKKPHPDIFNFALNKSKALPHNSVMIGDCLTADVQGALDVGMSAIFFNPHNFDADSSINQVNNLEELLIKF